MMFEELISAHAAELKVQRQTIEHRIAWSNISRLERAQRALKSAGRKMHVTSNFSARMN